MNRCLRCRTAALVLVDDLCAACHVRYRLPCTSCGEWALGKVCGLCPVCAGIRRLEEVRLGRAAAKARWA